MSRGGPRGEEQVRAALIDAATELFAERGPSAVTVRQIAEQAGVNHGLVHHYFGSKDALLADVLEVLSRQSAAEAAADPAAFFVVGGAAERHGRILAHLLLEGRDITAHQSEFPSIQALIEGYRSEAGVSDADARARAAQVAAMVMGWQLFEPFLTTAAGLELTDDARRALLDDAVHALLRRPAPPHHAGDPAPSGVEVTDAGPAT